MNISGTMNIREIPDVHRIRLMRRMKNLKIGKQDIKEYCASLWTKVKSH